jgi:hypothetical protein
MYCINISLPQGVCTEAGMFALRERRVHVTQEDFEMAVSKVIDPFYIRYIFLFIITEHGHVQS